MSIDEIIKKGANTAIVLNAEELKTIIAQTVEDTRKEALCEVAQKEEEIYYSIKEVSQILRKSRVTLWRWEERGYLCPIAKVGNSPRYRKTDIDRLLNGQANG